jgi:hypothetical protein
MSTFWVSFPDSIKLSLTPFSSDRFSMAFEVNSVPLSQTMVPGRRSASLSASRIRLNQHGAHGFTLPNTFGRGMLTMPGCRAPIRQPIASCGGSRLPLPIDGVLPKYPYRRTSISNGRESVRRYPPSGKSQQLSDQLPAVSECV